MATLDETIAVVFDDSGTRKLRRMFAARRLADAITDAPPDMVQALVDGFAGVRLAENRAKGGKARAARARDMPEWMVEIFDRAYLDLERDGTRVIGWSLLLGKAWRVAGRAHPQREKLTKHQAQKYLGARRAASR